MRGQNGDNGTAHYLLTQRGVRKKLSIDGVKECKVGGGMRDEFRGGRAKPLTCRLNIRVSGGLHRMGHWVLVPHEKAARDPGQSPMKPCNKAEVRGQELPVGLE